MPGAAHLSQTSRRVVHVLLHWQRALRLPECYAGDSDASTIKRFKSTRAPNTKDKKALAEVLAPLAAKVPVANSKPHGMKDERYERLVTSYKWSEAEYLRIIYEQEYRRWAGSLSARGKSAPVMGEYMPRNTCLSTIWTVSAVPVRGGRWYQKNAQARGGARHGACTLCVVQKYLPRACAGPTIDDWRSGNNQRPSTIQQVWGGECPEGSDLSLVTWHLAACCLYEALRSRAWSATCPEGEGSDISECRMRSCRRRSSSTHRWIRARTGRRKYRFRRRMRGSPFGATIRLKTVEM